jgi:3-hydroxyisobutyrate dehydrogenase-like beta-hydroxyacid dehydrogenase
MTQKLAFIGLGAMGFPMAGHLVRSGYDVTVYNRTLSTAEKWVKQFATNDNVNASLGTTPHKAAKDADVVLLCVGNDDDVRSVVYGQDGVLSAMNHGATLIDHTTTSAELARELHKVAKDYGIDVLDAPVSGGQAGAENGTLTVMLGGNAEVYSNVHGILNCYSQKHQLMGDIGKGQLTKMVNQICIAGVVQGLSEALHFAQKADLDSQAVVDVISKGAAASWQMVNRSETMVKGEFDFGFAVDWMRKDLDIVLSEAKRNGSSLPITALVDQFYSQVQANGGGRWDTSSLISLLDK